MTRLERRVPWRETRDAFRTNVKRTCRHIAPSTARRVPMSLSPLCGSPASTRKCKNPKINPEPCVRQPGIYVFVHDSRPVIAGTLGVP